jgi:hypothetical protein
VGATGSLVPFQTPLATPAGPGANSLTPILTPLSTTTAAALAPPQTTDLAVSSITRSSATITWTTTAPSTSQVEFGAQASPLSRSPLDPSLVTAHSVVLTGLQPATTYRFHTLSATSGGASTTSPDTSFITAPPGSGPDITDPVVEQATGTLAHVGWSTSTGTVAQVEYGTNTNYGSFTLLQVYSGPAQDMALTGLRPATLYHFRVKAWDALGGLGASADATFATAPSGLANLIGDDTVQTDRLTLSGGQAAAYQYYASQSGLASVAHVYIDAGSSTQTLRVALYSDLNGTPVSILSQGSTSSVAPGWTSVNISPVALLAGSRYWVALLNPLGSGVVNLRQSPSGGSSLSGAQTSLAAFPQPFTGGIPAAHAPLSLYVQQVPPAVTLTAPTDGSVVNGQAQITAVVDDDAAVSRVQFYVDGQPVGAPLSAAPYALAWDSAGLSPALPHTLSARATDALGRSGVSSNVNVQVDNGPAISNVSAGPGLTASSARVTWTTDIAADGQVEFGDSTAYGLTTPVDPAAGVRHDMQLTGLTPGATYHYRVRSRDAAGALSVSPDTTLVTAAPDNSN